MNKIKGISWLIIVLMAFSFVSCQKEEEAVVESKLHMTGTLNLNVPDYIDCSELVTISVDGVYYPEQIQYKWRIPELYEDTLLGQKLVIRMPSEQGTFTITAMAVNPEYYSLTASKTVTLISQEKSLVGREFKGGQITDERDGKVYRTSYTEDLEWFAENLAWEGAGGFYENNEALGGLFGRLYNWTEATGGVEGEGFLGGPQGVCPEGWTVPTAEDWAYLGSLLSEEEVSFFKNWPGVGEQLTVEAIFNGSKMWPISPDNAKYNKYYWNALPTGYSLGGNTIYRELGKYGMWWSSKLKSADQAYYRYIYFDENACGINYSNIDDIAFAVRCVRKHDTN
ncbi:MAG: hypothetical protein GX664_02590 [Bacteroidales bacterium]|jgi:uncharacterized protein (TIGR02145 family)|nr:hypothetical protein [Bacteroidales bacterium]